MKVVHIVESSAMATVRLQRLEKLSALLSESSALIASLTIIMHRYAKSSVLEKQMHWNLENDPRKQAPDPKVKRKLVAWVFSTL